MATLIQYQLSSIFVDCGLLFSQVDSLASPVVTYLFDLFALAVIQYEFSLIFVDLRLLIPYIHYFVSLAINC